MASVGVDPMDFQLQQQEVNSLTMEPKPVVPATKEMLIQCLFVS